MAEAPDSTVHTLARPGVAHPTRRTAVLSVALLGLSVALLGRLDVWSLPQSDVHVQWWWIAVCCIASELMVINIEFRREVYTFTFSEIPLVLGLFLASPAHLIVGRLVGAGLLLTLKERQPPSKLILNLSSFFAECAVLLTMFHLMGGRDGTVLDPMSWIYAFGSIAAADILGFVVVAKVVRWHGGPLRFRSILAIGAMTAPVNTSFALATVLLLSAQPWATLLLSGLAAFLMLSYRSYLALSQRYESLNMLYDFTRLVSGSQRPEDVLEAILIQAKNLLRAERAEIWLVDDDARCLRLVVDDDHRTHNELSAEQFALTEQWFGNGPQAFVVTKADNHATKRAIARVFDARDCIVAPVTEGGEVVGMLAVINRLGETNGFGSEDTQVFATLANHASVALENGKLIDRLHVQTMQREHDLLHDALTGLPNRVKFDNALSSRLDALANNGSLAVVVMDLNGFKEINDTLGHQSGDRVLIEVATRISRFVDRNVDLARLGGDEFALLLPDVESDEAVARYIGALRHEVSAPVQISGMRVNVGVSIGVSVAPRDGIHGALLLQRADVAMYGAKDGLGDGVNFYRADADTNSPRRLALANDLTVAIEHDELSLVFQPKVRMADAKLVGFEALIRWRHPRLGPIGPDEFIPLAERTGSIHAITQFVLTGALRETAAWHAQGLDCSVAINLSMRNLLNEELMSTVAALISKSEVDPSLVTLEITETSVMADAGRSIAVLDQLHDLGVRLSIDDFGTGYSSLSHLRRLPIQEVKIDKSFVLPMMADPNADAIVRSVLDLARNMQLSVVAEGVEDVRTWRRLQALGCPVAQGYFLARPMAAAAATSWSQTLAERGLADGWAENQHSLSPDPFTMDSVVR